MLIRVRVSLGAADQAVARAPSLATAPLPPPLPPLLQLVPRIDMAALALPPEQQRRGFRPRGGVRPAQRLFAREDVTEASHGAVPVESAVWRGHRVLVSRRWGGRERHSPGGSPRPSSQVMRSARFKDGLLLKEVKPSAITGDDGGGAGCGLAYDVRFLVVGRFCLRLYVM